ncbi:MAG: hypothetical protein QW400_02165 [Candidatus Diapherotrites archaeon]
MDLRLKFGKKALLFLFFVFFAASFLLFFRANFLGMLLGKENEVSKPADVHTTPTAEASVKEKKGQIELIEITLHDCNGCLNFDYLKAQLKDMNIIVDEKTIYYPSEDAQKIIEQYSVKTLPTIIVKGDFKDIEVFRNWSSFGRILSDTLVFDNNIPVYYDLTAGRFVGAVKIIELIDGSCQECVEPITFLSALTASAGINVVDFKRVDVNSDEGKELAKRHYIEFVPALIFSKEISDYNIGDFSAYGTFGPDGSFVVREKFPPYKDLKSGEVKGVLHVTMVEHSSCWACQGAKEMLAFLRGNLGLSFKNVLVYDINSNEARALMKNYSIGYLPAALVFGDTAEYKLFSEHWPKLGVVFKDGIYMFDNYKLLGPGYYFDVNNEQIFYYGAESSG